MKCRAFKLLVFLLLGAIVNVAVAWACVLRYHDDCVMTESILVLAMNPHGAWPNQRTPLQMATQFIETNGLRYTVTVSRAKGSVFIIRAGWPGFSLMGSWQRNATPALWRIPQHELLTELHVPIWPGFAINTIFYAAVLWMLFAFPFALRRRRRIKRGLCPACAYRIGTSEVCTECGKPVTR